MKENFQGWIYKITNTVNGKVYVGQTIQKKVSRRWNGHRSSLNRGVHKNKHLQASWDKYGQDAFKFDVIEQFDSELNFDLNNLEKYWIKHYDSMNPNRGYNKTEGGEGFSPSEETRKKLSYAHRGKIITFEQREKISKTLKGRSLSLETRKKISENKKGKPSNNNNLRRVLCVNTSKEYESLIEAARELGCHRQKISRVCSGKQKHTKGFKFQYLENKEAS